MHKTIVRSIQPCGARRALLFSLPFRVKRHERLFSISIFGPPKPPFPHLPGLLRPLFSDDVVFCDYSHKNLRCEKLTRVSPPSPSPSPSPSTKNEMQRVLRHDVLCCCCCFSGKVLTGRKRKRKKSGQGETNKYGVAESADKTVCSPSFVFPLKQRPPYAECRAPRNCTCGGGCLFFLVLPPSDIIVYFVIIIIDADFVGVCLCVCVCVLRLLLFLFRAFLVYFFVRFSAITPVAVFLCVVWPHALPPPHSLSSLGGIGRQFTRYVCAPPVPSVTPPLFFASF